MGKIEKEASYDEIVAAIKEASETTTNGATRTASWTSAFTWRRRTATCKGHQTTSVSAIIIVWRQTAFFKQKVQMKTTFRLFLPLQIFFRPPRTMSRVTICRVE